MGALSSPDGARYGSGHSVRLGRRQTRRHRHGLLGTAARAVRPRCVQQRASRIILTPDVTVNPTSWEIRVQACLMIPSALAVPSP